MLCPDCPKLRSDGPKRAWCCQEEARRALRKPKPTVYEALREKLGREPTHAELCTDVRRILAESTRELAEAGRLKHQRKR